MILALKTADHTTQILLIDDPQSNPTAILEWGSGRELSDKLLAQITELLASHGHQLRDLTGIVIFSGPGSFTSLRIGHTVANALADSLGIPVAGATGEDWIVAATKQLAHTPPGHPALPHYGAEANITKPKS